MISIKNIYIVGLALVSLLFVFGCKSNKKQATQSDHAAFKENMVKANRGLVEMDQDRIKAYVNRRGWEMDVSETGLWNQILSSEEGDSVFLGKVVHLKYQINLLDGTFCYSSDSTGNLVFKVGHGGVESGLEEAVLLMKTGDKGRFVMPPHLAHGLLGDNDKIPSRTIIVYQAELLKLTDY